MTTTHLPAVKPPPCQQVAHSRLRHLHPACWPAASLPSALSKTCHKLGQIANRRPFASQSYSDNAPRRQQNPPNFIDFRNFDHHHVTPTRPKYIKIASEPDTGMTRLRCKFQGMLFDGMLAYSAGDSAFFDFAGICCGQPDWVSACLACPHILTLTHVIIQQSINQPHIHDYVILVRNIVSR